MSVKTAFGTYLCGSCGKEFNTPSEADAHRDSHELIYVPFKVADLNSLMHFIYTKDDTFLTESLMSTIQRYLQGN